MRKNIIASVILTCIILFIPNYSYSWTTTTRWDPDNMDGWYAWDSGWGMPTVGATLIPAQPDGNTRTLRITIPKGAEATGYLFGGASRPFPSTEEVWAQFYLLFPNNYKFHTVTDKFSGWGKWPGESNNLVVTFGNGEWGVMPQNDWPGFWQGFYPTESNVPATRQKNHWYKIVQHLKMNTPGKFDGIYEMWVDDQLVMRHNNVGYREAGNNTGFTGIRHLVVWGGITNSIFQDEETYVYYGTSTVSSQNLGTIPTSIGKEPMAPTKITIK